jgi:hypothetical protein
MNRFAPVALAATAVVVVILIGISIFARSPEIGPSPIPGPTDSSTAEPSATFKPAAPASWAATGSMSQARVDFTATLLLDGRVLVTGGDLGYDAVPRALATAELYDPATGTWSATGSMLQGRYRHTATLLPDGRVLVAGGNVNGSQQIGVRCCLATAELYDPATGTWTATGNLIAPRVDHIASLLPDGTVLVAGGIGTDDSGSLPRFIALDAAVLYDPRTGSSTATGSLNALRDGHFSATLMPNGMVLVVGGDGRDYAVLASAELYDPGTRTWIETASLSEARQGHRAILLPNGTVLVVGGTGREDPVTGALGALLASAELYTPGGN